jgi:hypothetical protein
VRFSRRNKRYRDREEGRERRGQQQFRGNMITAFRN